MNNTEDILQRSIRIYGLPPGFNPKPILDVITSSLSEIQDYKKGYTDLIVTFKSKDEKESAEILQDTDVEGYNIKMDVNLQDLNISEPAISSRVSELPIPKPALKNLTDINLEQSTFAFERQRTLEEQKPLIPLIEQRPIENYSAKISQNDNFSRNSEEIRSELRFPESPNIIKEEPREEETFRKPNTTSSKRASLEPEERNAEPEFLKPASNPTAKESFSEEDNKTVFVKGNALSDLHNKLQGANLPMRHTLHRNDRFFNSTKNEFLLVFTAAWAFIWFICSV